MKVEEFRQQALSFAGAIESAHMNHPDFRAGKKPIIFASLGKPDVEWAMVKLTPEQQQVLLASNPDVFQPCSGAWGERGYTNLHLPSAKKSVGKMALQMAYENVTSE